VRLCAFVCDCACVCVRLCAFVCALADVNACANVRVCAPLHLYVCACVCAYVRACVCVVTCFRVRFSEARSNSLCAPRGVLHVVCCTCVLHVACCTWRLLACSHCESVGAALGFDGPETARRLEVMRSLYAHVSARRPKVVGGADSYRDMRYSLDLSLEQGWTVEGETAITSL
jgi:hypothetical protein